jgi:hypothetical protein
MESTDHGWPTDPAAHVWDKWTSHTARQGTKPPMQSRRCVHPDCTAFEVREAPSV